MKYLRKLMSRESFLVGIICFGLIILPFVYWPRAEVSHEVPKVWFFKRFIEIIFIIGLLSWVKQYRVKNKKLLFSTLVFLLYATFISIFGHDLSKSLIGNYYRWDGLITYYYLFAFSLFIAYFVNKKRIGIVVDSISLSSIIVSIIFLIKNTYNHTLSISTAWEHNVVGIFFGNPNFLAGYLLITLPLVYYSTKKRGGRGIVLVVLQIIALVFTFTRTALLGIPIFIMYEILIIPNFRFRKQMFFVSIMFVLIISSILVSNWKSSMDPYSFSAESRQRIYTKAIIALTEKPFLGWGWANFDFAFSSVDWPIEISQDVYVDKAHSSILEVFVSTGVIGGILYLGVLFLITISVFMSTDPYSKSLLGALLLYVVHSQTNVLSISEEIVFWFILGVAMKKDVKILSFCHVFFRKYLKHDHHRD